jgi:hypothetical protein
MARRTVKARRTVCLHCRRPLVSVTTFSALDGWSRFWSRLCNGNCPPQVLAALVHATAARYSTDTPAESLSADSLGS